MSRSDGHSDDRWIGLPQGSDRERDPGLVDLLNPAFMARYTDFSSLQQMLDESGFRIESGEDFHRIPEEEWNTFVAQRTAFASWSELQARAAVEWASRSLRTRGNDAE